MILQVVILRHNLSKKLLFINLKAYAFIDQFD